MKGKTLFLRAAWAVLLSACLVVSVADAEEGVWAGSAEVGGLQTSGNTQTRTLNAAAKGDYSLDKWRFALGGKATVGSDRGITTTEHYHADGSGRYALTERLYTLATLDYDKDRFSGYKYRLSESLGLGYMFVDSASLQISVEAGVGFRQSTFNNKRKEKDTIGRGALHGKWQANEMVALAEEMTVEGGKNGTVNTSDTSITAMLTKVLAAKFSYKTTTNSKPVVGTKKTDTETSANLVYKF
jgi:putative salt-induced outer membrane protein